MKLNIRQPIISMLNLLCLFSLCILMLNKIALIYLFVFLMCWLMNPCITKANYILSLSLQGKKKILLTVPSIAKLGSYIRQPLMPFQYTIMTISKFLRYWTLILWLNKFGNCCFSCYVDFEEVVVETFLFTK